MDKNILEKHKKYVNTYKPNELYWGLGIENELYIQFENEIEFDYEKFLKNHNSERYSVNYFNIYKKDLLNNFLKKIEYSGKLPLLLNSHSFTKTDMLNNPKTLYTKKNETNPNFTGVTLWEFIIKNNEYLRENYDKNIVFDGDSIEIITLNFFKATLQDTIDELNESRKNLIYNLRDVFYKNNIFKNYGNIKLIEKNHPFAVMMTNPNNMCMFNNGTLHFNITLPTELNEKCEVKNMMNFIEIHKNYIKLIQYMEPLFISIYGSPDPLSKYSNLFSPCSQRNAVSRYISIGTYNTDNMPIGKILTENIENLFVSTSDYGWYKRYYNECGYIKLDKIGYDINFNKHLCHGIEIRFFDHINDINQIKEVLKMLIYLADYSLENYIGENPIILPEWNDIVYECMKYGKNTIIKTRTYEKLFRTEFLSDNVVNIYYEIMHFLENKYKNDGQFSKYTIKNENNEITRLKDIINNINIRIDENSLNFQSKINNIDFKSDKIMEKISKIEKNKITKQDGNCCSIL